MFQRVVVDPAKIRPPDIFLTSEQQHYLTRVLRLKAGDRFIAMDGQGHSWLAVLGANASATITEAIPTRNELPTAVTLVIALPKGNAFDEIVHQVTELGVNQIVPVINERTLLNPSLQKLERWRRIAQEAAEQSERQLVPTLLDPISFADHLQSMQASPPSTAHYLCTPRHSAPHLLTVLLPSLAEKLSDTHSLLSTPHPPSHLAIGPEGGWTDTEVEQAIAVGYQLVSLGDRILRTVTAPIVALSLITAVQESTRLNQITDQF